ncbi:cobalamin-independent methionine synthase II family protein [Corynebacterium guangdongense]|uniref:5-methyltetrahydropteroyltriglutamate--homocysteine methyltransferase n=1 Tax=Corynebacterium guangdongense TaxID=1783348 RepID=A0ABU1ZXR3_9CORY|nr:cobalamin-independent methionine synthase II family protein [Corynebacterium guangdongense]MDR7329715.1 5-methyltetrahydropteroyltriglutamate--homocysteine methyltransferase [Corynebacterium guangdongense]WJZ18279.1 2-hydroxypropyl-CoM lyase [Corynebacterium guangdongense]
MSNKILTTHVGSLPRTPELLDANQQRAEGTIAEDKFFEILQDSIDKVVQRQVDMGVDIVNEGEYGHITSGAIDYGAWWNYSFSRLGGLTMTDEDRWAAQDVVRSTPGNIQLTSFADRRDRQIFADAYNDPESGIFAGRAKVGNPKFTGPVTYVGQEEVAADVKLLRAAMDKAGAKDAFVAALSPGSAARLKNEYYDTETELVQACADAMHHEYKAITDAGFTVQLDAPDLAEAWDQINPEPSVADFQDWLKIRIDAINSALEGLPAEQTRLHICWGSWHGPHSTDVPFEDIIDVIMEAKVGGVSFEGSSPRHAHEWRVWRNRELPQGYKLYPGLISHSTNAIEHPRLIADRIIKFAEQVGPENVIASSDCGLGGRLHQQIAWAKLEALVEGARIASDELF